MPRDSPPGRSRDWPRPNRVPIRAGLPALALCLLLVASAVPLGAAAGVPTFGDNAVQTQQGETASTTVEFPDGTSETRFSLGSDAAGVRVTATVVDADGDGSATLNVDTGNVSADAPNEALSVGDGDELRTVSVSETPSDGSLAAGDYDLALGPADDPTDLGTLYVAGATGTDAGGNGSGTDDTSPTATPKHVEGTVVVHSGRYVSLENDTETVVHGETHLPAGTVVTVQLKSKAETAPPFYETRDVEVADDGTFAATFDLSDQRGGPNQLVDVVVRRGTTHLTSAVGRITDCTDCATPTQAETPTGGDELGFGADVVNVVQLHDAEIPVWMGSESTATLVVGDEQEVGYELVAHLDDTAGDAADGRVVVSFRTEGAGHRGRTVYARTDGDRDGVKTLSETELVNLLDDGDYPLALYRGNDTAGEPVDTARLRVFEPQSYEESYGATETPAPDGDDATPASATPTAPPADHESRDSNRFLYGFGGLVVGGGVGIAGVLVLLRGGA